MNVQRHEIQNYTPEQVSECLRTAIDLADELIERGPEWRAVFAQACQLVSSKQTIIEQMPTVDLGQILGNGRRQ